MATATTISLTASTGETFSIGATDVIYATDNSDSLAVLTYKTQTGFNKTVTLNIDIADLQDLAQNAMFLADVIDSAGDSTEYCFNNTMVVKLNDVTDGCNMIYLTNVDSTPMNFLIDDTAANISADAATMIDVTDDTTQEIYYISGARCLNIEPNTETSTVLDSAVVVAAGTTQVVGDILTLTGGTYTTQAKVAVATTKPVSLATNAAGTGYVPTNTILTAGGTASTHATLTVTNTKLISVANLAAGTGYDIADTITLSGGTASTKGIVTVATTKLISASVNAAGTGVVAGSTLLTLVGGTHSITATATVATTKVVSATVAAGGTGDLAASAGVIVEGTTGTGTKFRASVTIGAGNEIASVQSITVAGNYTANPTTIATEPVIYISGGAGGSTLTGAQLAVVMGALTVTATTAGSYTVQSATFTTTGGNNDVTLNAASFGVLTHTLSTAGVYTVNGTTFTQFATSGAGTGATFDTPVYGVNVAAITTAGSYTVNSSSFTQNTTSGSGTGATFNTVVYGVNTVTVNTAGAYTTPPTNPVAQGASTGSGINATFTATFAEGEITGCKIDYNDERLSVPSQLSVEETKAQVVTAINAL